MSFKSDSLSFRQGNVNSFERLLNRKALGVRSVLGLSFIGVGLHLTPKSLIRCERS